MPKKKNMFLKALYIRCAVRTLTGYVKGIRRRGRPKKLADEHYLKGNPQPDHNQKHQYYSYSI